MSDIKEYRKEHQENDYDKKLRTHKLKLYGIIGGIVVLVAVLATVLLIIKQKNSYSSYVTEYSVRRTDRSREDVADAEESKSGAKITKTIKNIN